MQIQSGKPGVNIFRVKHVSAENGLQVEHPKKKFGEIGTLSWVNLHDNEHYHMIMIISFIITPPMVHGTSRSADLKNRNRRACSFSPNADHIYNHDTSGAMMFLVKSAYTGIIVLFHAPSFLVELGLLRS